MPTEMQGRRIPITPDSDPTKVLKLPGDYCGPDRRNCVHFLLPIADPADPFWGSTPGCGLHAVSSPPWRFTEEPDGSLTVRESILAGKHPGYWHGFLTCGRWELSKSKP